MHCPWKNVPSPESSHRFAGWILTLALVGLALGTVQAGEQEAYDHAVNAILCDCGCPPQSPADCTCGRAAQMRKEIRGLAASGLTGKEIVQRYVDEHGEGIRIVPLASGFNLVAWIGPLVGLAAGLALVFLVVRRWKRAGGEEPESPALDTNDPYINRLRREIEES